jgi:hypothetical protein
MAGGREVWNMETAGCRRDVETPTTSSSSARRICQILPLPPREQLCSRSCSNKQQVKRTRHALAWVTVGVHGAISAARPPPDTRGSIILVRFISDSHTPEIGYLSAAAWPWLAQCLARGLQKAGQVASVTSTMLLSTEQPES